MVVIEPVVTFLSRFATQLIMCMLLFAPALQRRKLFWVRLAVGLAVYCVFPYAITGFGKYRIYANPYLYIGWLNLNWLAVLLVGMAFMLFTFKIGLPETLFFATSAYAMQHLMRRIAEIIITIFSITGFWRYFTIMTVGLACMVAFYFIFAKRIKSRECLGIKNIHIIVLSIITISIVYVLSVYVGREGESTVYSGKIYAAVCSLLLLVIQFGLFEQEKKEKERFEIEKILHDERELHRISKENIELINIKCHDLKHQLAAIRRVSDNDSFKSGLKEIEKAILIYDSIAKTGNDTVDMIISEKSLKCEKYGIKFTYMVQAECLAAFDEMDLYSLLGNAIDNAIEAALQLDDVSKRNIGLKINRNGEVICFHFENYTENKITFKDGLPLTTKENKQYHGYGMKSIKYIVDKYKGHMTVNFEDNIFNLDIIIPLK